LNLGSNTFAGGQAYTGLSRCTTLDGLSLTDFHLNSIRANPKVLQFYKKYSALKHRLIEDGDENEKVRENIMKLLEQHIPSALSVKRKRRSFKKNITKDKKSHHVNEESHHQIVNDEDCPF